MNQKIFCPEVKIELKKFFPLLAALLGQQLLGLLVNLLDNFMLGLYAEASMSGATVVNQIQTVAGNLIFGVGSGVAILGSQYWGKKETRVIKKIFSDGLKTSFVIGIFFTALSFLFPTQIITLLTSDPAIQHEAAQYLSIMCWTYLIYSLSYTLLISLQAVETAFVGTIMSASTIVINGILNYTFIFGNFGAPELGIRGAAIATLTSRSIELIIVLVYILFVDQKVGMKIKDFFVLKTGYYADYIKVAFPIIFTGAMWGVGLAAQTSILGHMSTEAIGASSISVTVASLFLVTSYASTSATGVVMGKTVGRGRLDVVRPLTKAFQLILVAMGVIMGTALLLLKDQIIGFYAVSEGTRLLAGKFLVIMAISIMGSTYEYPLMSGIIAGGGDTKYQTIIDTSFMWGFTIPLSALSAFVFNWPPEITFLILKIDQVLKCIPNGIYCNSYKWIKDRTR